VLISLVRIRSFNLRSYSGLNLGAWALTVAQYDDGFWTDVSGLSRMASECSIPSQARALPNTPATIPASNCGVEARRRRTMMNGCHQRLRFFGARAAFLRLRTSNG
jgi:hypothetical protein